MDVDPPAAPAAVEGAGGSGGGAVGGSRPRRAADPALVSQVCRGGSGGLGGGEGGVRVGERVGAWSHFCMPNSSSRETTDHASL